MRKPPRNQKECLILLQSLENLRGLYASADLTCGRLARIGIKPRWTTLIGTGNECGLAARDPANECGTGVNQIEIIKALDLVGQSLFDVAEAGIRSFCSPGRSLGIAALSALSQRFIGCSSIRNRGYRAQCWTAEDEFSCQYPAISRLVKPDDIVVFAGVCREMRDLAGLCREIHVLDSCPPESYQTILIDRDIEYGPPGITPHPWDESGKVLRKADVLILPAVTLVNNTLAGMAGTAKHARLVGLTGPGCSLIPDVFFDQGIDFISSYRITKPQQFADAMIHEINMECALRLTQKPFVMMRSGID